MTGWVSAGRLDVQHLADVLARAARQLIRRPPYLAVLRRLGPTPVDPGAAPAPAVRPHTPSNWPGSKWLAAKGAFTTTSTMVGVRRSTRATVGRKSASMRAKNSASLAAEAGATRASTRETTG